MFALYEHSDETRNDDGEKKKVHLTTNYNKFNVIQVKPANRTERG